MGLQAIKEYFLGDDKVADAEVELDEVGKKLGRVNVWDESDLRDMLSERKRELEDKVFPYRIRQIVAGLALGAVCVGSSLGIHEVTERDKVPVVSGIKKNE